MTNTSDHIGNDVFFKEETDTVKLLSKPYLANKQFLILCTSGYAKGTIDLKEFEISKDNLLILFPVRIVQFTEFSHDYNALVISTSIDYSRSMQHNESISIWMRLLSDPIVHLTDKETAMMTHCFKIVSNVIDTEGNEHKLEAIRKIFEAMFYIGIDFEDIKHHRTRKMSRKEKVFDDFYTNLIRYHRQSREVQFYADKLCITPKYMSNIIKVVTGLSALEWINNYIVLEAKMVLSSNPKMTIQEVADYLGFPDQSFFGKFFKKHIGMTPSDFKKR